MPIGGGPTNGPTSSPTISPTPSRTTFPTGGGPTDGPTSNPTISPTPSPTTFPTGGGPTNGPTSRPTIGPTSSPTLVCIDSNQNGFGEVSADGSIDEWDLSEAGPDFIGNLYEAGNAENDVAAKFYARLECSTSTLCIMVNSMDSTTFKDSPADTWFKNYNEQEDPLTPLGDGIVKVFDGFDFVAWEACYTIPLGTMEGKMTLKKVSSTC